MFGTDQMQWPDAIERAIGVTEAAPLFSEEPGQNLTRRNAARFLWLDEMICAEDGGR
jgi:hypothetical protein